MAALDISDAGGGAAATVPSSRGAPGASTVVECLPGGHAAPIAALSALPLTALHAMADAAIATTHDGRCLRVALDVGGSTGGGGSRAEPLPLPAGARVAALAGARGHLALLAHGAARESVAREAARIARLEAALEARAGLAPGASRPGTAAGSRPGTAAGGRPGTAAALTSRPGTAGASRPGTAAGGGRPGTASSKPIWLQSD